MQLAQREKELAAIGASIGANCQPCIEHHVAAGRDAGLSESELEDAVTTAHAIRSEAVELLRARIDELLGHVGSSPEPPVVAHGSKRHELVALGASVGANSHALLRRHVGAALEAGLESRQVKGALKMAEHVQQRASDITADVATEAVGALAQTASNARDSEEVAT